MKWRRDGNERGNAPGAETAQIVTRDQTAHAVRDEYDALGTGRGPVLVDPRVELLGEPLDIGERRPVVDRIDPWAAIARQEAPSPQPYTGVHQYAVDE